MEYYAIYNTKDKILGKSQCECSGEYTVCIPITSDIYNNFEQYIYSNGEIIINPEWDNIQLDNAKESKIAENDTVRDKKLLEGVTYSNVLFDSDNEQKINLLAKYSMMSDTDTVVWYGMDNQPLLCTKDDLMAIGQLIETLHTFCWENNAYIKEQIAQAKTIEQLEEIDISYDRVDT